MTSLKSCYYIAVIVLQLVVLPNTTKFIYTKNSSFAPDILKLIKQIPHVRLFQWMWLYI